MTKILVIEDEEIVRANILEILESGEFEAIGAENGRIGIEIAENQIPDLVICDITMPEIDGYGVLEKLRQNPSTATIPFIFLTARADKTDFRTGMNLGADDYLTKPFRRQELLACIAARLRKQAAYEQRSKRELRQVEAQLNYSLYYDQLTKLPNQLLLRERFQQNLKQSDPREFHSIMLVDLDRFDEITEALGNKRRDLLIQEVASRLTVAVNAKDTVARLQTHKFAIILTPRERATGEAIAQNVLNLLNRPFQSDGYEVCLAASIGIAATVGDGDDLDGTIKNAQIALSHAKQLGGNQYQIYTPELQRVSIDKLALESSLRYALERSELLLQYQPQVSLFEGRITSAEALIRWRHPRRGMVSPGEFIPLAEANGAIVPIGEWVLRTACAQVQKWRTAGLPPVRVAVNISARQFQQSNLTDRLVQILSDTGVPPEFLELELTESTLVQNVAEAKQRLQTWKDLGLKISLDDFGTGYSSLSYLQQFPFDIIKIDRSFVSHVNSDPKNAALTKTIISMAETLNLKVVAEGVETEAELAFLHRQGCGAIQGYFFSRPISADEFAQMLHTDKRLHLPPTQQSETEYATNAF
ncbi:MAG TPA: EAL domain-containing protein [Oscillatoriaceae cyanobacterium M33_DOE_052]|uniref:GGDEF domain-containing response regulator n=1 Tax=Planktothricoides sp. SpSt-374 TaxID=2282167 RepID=A0A7C3ZLW4_9CYAN|nr:EAL domain-containing protein [Oscillatoriaceae cyanobacterium M33_DOE_052]